jgi:hypothetical protein
LALHPCYCNTSHHLPWWVWTEEGKRGRAAHITPIQGGSSRWFRHNRETFIPFHESWRYIQGLNKSPPDNLPLPMATWHPPSQDMEEEGNPESIFGYILLLPSLF